jgi:isopenicillin N synthase-like dioxygenase
MVKWPKSLPTILALTFLLGCMLTVALARAKGIALPENFFNQAKGASKEGLLPCSRYAKMPQEYDDVNKLVPPSDWGPLTIIYSESTGLQDFRDGKWVQLPARKGQLSNVIGEVLAAWSNLLFEINIHCVSPQTTPDRISYGFFCGKGLDLSRSDTNEDGIEPVYAPGETPQFGKISSGSHLEYTKVYLSG